jgi:hypothetical protein
LAKSNQIGSWIGVEHAQKPGRKLISSPVRPNERIADAKLLLRLGIGLGLAYVVFLVAWFWTTRDRRHGVARVVRF